MSEGEISEDRAAKTTFLPQEPKEAKPVVKTNYGGEPTARNSRDERPLNTSSGTCDSSPRHTLPNHLKPQAPRRPEEHRDEVGPEEDKRQHFSKYTNDRRPYHSDSERSPYHRRDVREQNEEPYRSEIKIDKFENTSRPQSEAKPPTLEEVLPHNEDLNEWLEITGYHNGAYRKKVLNRCRAIAALDAQKAALLAEVEVEERGVVQTVNGVSITSAFMLPPPVLNKAGDRAEPFPNSTAAPELQQHDPVVSNKRTHSEVRGSRKASNSKIAHTNDRPRPKHEDDFDRPRSSDFDPSRRRSFDGRRDDRESFRGCFEEERGRGRHSAARDHSPGRMAFESRPPGRSRGYDGGDNFSMHDRDDWETRDRGRSEGRGNRRPFEVRGGYRGRAFDPNYRSRGGGRGGSGRGDYQSHTAPRVGSGAFGARIANGKPYKDTKGFDRGG